MWELIWHFAGGLLWVAFPILFVCIAVRRLFNRKALRFSLRSLFAAVLYLAVCFSWASPERARYRAEEECVRRVAVILNAAVDYERFTGVRSPLCDFRHLDFIDLSNVTVNDAQIGELVIQLKQLPKLHEIYISSNSMSPTALERLRNELPTESYIDNGKQLCG
jgi:hypothetical protein